MAQVDLLTSSEQVQIDDWLIQSSARISKDSLEFWLFIRRQLVKLHRTLGDYNERVMETDEFQAFVSVLRVIDISSRGMVERAAQDGLSAIDFSERLIELGKMLIVAGDLDGFLGVLSVAGFSGRLICGGMA
jgi:hypothetical protein